AYDDGTDYLFRVDQDGSVTPKDMRKTLGTFAGGTELVFFLTSDKRWNTNDTDGVFFTKKDWNPDTYSACGSGTFSKVYNIGVAINEGGCALENGWLASPALTRLDEIFDVELSGSYSMPVTWGQKFPHVIVGAPASDPNQWILGWEDLMGGGDADHNDMVFRIDRRTGGMAQLQSSQAISPSDPDAYFTAVTVEVYDNMPCGGQSGINYFVSIDNGANWVEILNWDFVKEFSGSGDSKTIGSDVTNWTPGNPALTYRLRRVDFSGSAMIGQELIWKAEMTSEDEDCIPEIIDVVLTGSVATHGFFSRASPSVQTNILYSGSYETPAIDWTEKVLRGHLYATRLYDPADPYNTTQTVATVWDAGAQLTAMSPASRTVYYPNITISTVTDEVIGTGDGTNTHFTGTLAHHPVSATTLIITDQYENIHDRSTDILEGDKGGEGTINRYTGSFDFNFDNPPGNGTPVLASYTYYTTSSTLSQFTTANVTNAMLGLDDTYIIPNGYLYDLNGDDSFTEADGDWLVGWIRGYANGTSTKKEWLLGQIDHSVPAVQTPPGRPAWYFGTAVTDEEREVFDTYVHDNWERPTVAYIGSRDGMLHAFDAGEFRWGYMDDDDNFVWGDNPKTIGDDLIEFRGYFEWSGDASSTADYGTGTELWAFIPTNLISRLKNNLLSGEDQAYVDASPAISDVYVNGSWKTVLLSAEGNGGDTVFCLNVTNPTSPTFMWEFSDPDLFRSRSSPAVAVIGKIALGGTKKWAAFFVSGKTYDNTLYPSVYMIDIANGSVIQRIFLDSETNGVGGVPSGQPAVVDSDGNGYIDRIYIGTDKGYLYKVTIPDDPTGGIAYGITECVINTDYADDFGNTVAINQRNHPIYASPAVVVQNGFNSDGEIEYNIKILYGTGDSPYYDENINTDDTTYHFFAYIDEAAKGVCNTGTVHLDWLYALPAGERIFASAFAAAGAIYFGTSTSETEDPCEGAGNPTSNAGKLYVMDINPAGDTIEPNFSLETGNILSAPVVDDEHLYVKTIGGGMMTTPGPYNNPVIMGGLVETGVR
ncbi:MAG: PilC/PilY family type IV pilus protein, partial [Desulfatirhabdiaceae bacterium]